MKNYLKISVFAFLFTAQFIFAFSVLAQDKKIELTNPLGGTEADPTGKTDINVIGGGIITTVMKVLGSITLLVFVVGGVMWLTSQGNPERVQMGSKTMLYAVIGIFIIFSSYAILKAVITGLTTV